MAGIYIHIPFCRQKCYYCDFYKTVNISLQQNFIEALKNEAKIRKNYLNNETVETIYFGGGTPSVLTAAELADAVNLSPSQAARRRQRLEAEGIGRPSTYASIIDTIQRRGYVIKQRNALVPTFTAFALTELLEKHFSDLVDLRFTARMEQQLDEIAVVRSHPIALAQCRDWLAGWGVATRPRGVRWMKPGTDPCI